MGMRHAPEVRLLRGEQSRLSALAESREVPARVALRARMVLLAAQGKPNDRIAREVGTDAATVARWRRRFLQQRIAGLGHDAPRPGRPPTIPTAKIQVVLRSTLGRRPPGGGFWSARTLAREVGLSKTTVQRIWKAHGLEPRRAAETFRPKGDGRFVDRITDLVGLYLDLPERAMVFSVDEQQRASRLAAPERRAMAEYEERRRGLEFRAFLQAVDRETPRALELHLLVDSRLTPGEPEVRRWLDRHPRFHLHFVPSGSDRPNVIERWFAQFTRRRLPPTAFPSVARLHRAVRDHLRLSDAASRPFVWTAVSEEIRDRTGRPAPDREPRGGARRPGA